MKKMTWTVVQFTPFFWFSEGKYEKLWFKQSYQHGTGGKFACLSRGGSAFLIDLDKPGAEAHYEWN